MNYIDYIVEHVKEHVPSVNMVWAISNALAIVQTVMNNYCVKNKWGTIKANDYYCNIGVSGGYKSLVPKMSTIPILKEVERRLDVFDGTGASIFLPDTGSSEGFAKHMNDTGVHFGMIDQDELSKMYIESKGKGYKSGDIEFLSRLWDGRTHRGATTGRGDEVIEDPYIVMIGSSTHVFIEGIHETFFRQGMGNRIVWSYLDHIATNYDRLEEDFFIQSIDDDYFAWTEGVIRHLSRVYSNTRRVMIVERSAAKMWIDYQERMNSLWLEEAKKHVTGWEYQPINRFPIHALKAAMAYAMADSKSLLIKDTPPMVLPEHMKKGIEFMELSQIEYNKIVGWKLAHSGRKIEIDDFTEASKTIVAKIKGSTDVRYFMLNTFEELVDAKNDYQRRQLIKKMEEIGLIRKVSKSGLPEEIAEKLFPMTKCANSLKAVIVM